MHVLIFLAAHRAQYDKFGEEGLKGGVPTGDGSTLHSNHQMFFFSAVSFMIQSSPVAMSFTEMQMRFSENSSVETIPLQVDDVF